MDAAPSPAPVVVRQVTDPADIPAGTGQLVLDAYASLPGYVSEPPYEAKLADVAARVPHAEVLVATDGPDGAVLGCATVVVDPTSPMSEDFRDGEVGLRMLGVAPAAQGRGVGQALLDATIARARATGGVTSVVLHSTQYMLAAHRLYERNGFLREPDRDIDLMDEIGIELRFYRLPL